MNLPPHLQKYQTRDIGQTLSQNLGTAAPPYVSIAGNRFTLIDAAGNEMPVPTFDPAIGVYLDACIIDSGDHISRTFYATKYDPSAAIFNPPDCWSDNGVGPLGTAEPAAGAAPAAFAEPKIADIIEPKMLMMFYSSKLPQDLPPLRRMLAQRRGDNSNPTNRHCDILRQPSQCHRMATPQ